MSDDRYSKQADKFWEQIDKAHPELRREAVAAAASAKQPEPRSHSPDEIWGYIRRDYPELRKATGVSIGLVGGIYRVAVTDQFHVLHTIKVAPKDIEADLAARNRAKKILRDNAKLKSSTPQKDKGNDRER